MLASFTNLLKNKIAWVVIFLLSMFTVFGVIYYRVSNNAQQNYKTALFDRKTPSDLEEVKAYIAKVKQAVANKEVLNLLPLQGDDLALWNSIKSNTKLIDLINKDNNNRNELFGIYTPKFGDLDNRIKDKCKDSNCKRVEIYNFANNTSHYVYADYKLNQIIDVNSFVNFQPEVPTHLVDLAIKLSSKDERITKFVGFNLDEKATLMAGTKTALNKTVCERSQHLCVSPTYIMPYKMAIWGIVDLTDMNLVAIRWTDLVKDGSEMPDKNTTEKKVANEIIDSKYCQKTNKFESGDWKMDYTLTSSDGMNFENITHKGKEIIKGTKLVDWHVSYSKDEGFGYSDAIGCPVFSQAAVVAAQEPKIKKIDNYTEFHQEYWSDGWPRPCNYYYEQAVRMFDDGGFRITAASLGRGCGTDGTYRPVTRIALGKDVKEILKFNGTDFVPLKLESQFEKKELLKNSQNHSFKIGNFGVVIPEKAQLDPSERGDEAFVYFTNNTNKTNEGDSDIPTIGACCNTDIDQGPNKFVNNEELNNEIVMWYVPQLKNDGAKGSEFCWADTLPNDKGTFDIKYYPCVSGPYFQPLTTN